MKRALVLSGGGSRGAYEIGAWQALEELGVRLDAVYGTSIGALNAGLVAQGDAERAAQLWSNITIGQIIKTDGEDFSIDRMISRKRDVIPFLLENAKYLNADVSPLENLLNTYLDERRVRAFGMELGVMTVRAPQMQPVPMRLKDMSEGQLSDWLIASASCFPVFPARRIGGALYVDGGYYDNMPVDMALQDGADEVIAVSVHPQPLHPEYTRMPFLRLIHPLHNLGGFLDFNPQLLNRGRQMGYYDAMKSFGRFDGIRYTFTPQSEIRIGRKARKFMRAIAAFDAEVITRAAFKSGEEMNAPLISAIESETPLRSLTWKEVWLRGLEMCAQQMGFREDAIYDPDALTRRITEYARHGEKVDALPGWKVWEVSKMGSRELISYLYRALIALGEFPRDCTETLSQFPKETAAALYLFIAQND